MHPAASVALTFLVSSSSLNAGVKNPSHNVQPTAAFAVCYGQAAPTAACNKQAILNINRARKQEGVKPIKLPGNYSSLSVDAQIVAVSNAERTARKLSAVKETTAWDQLAQQGANTDSDPNGDSTGQDWGAIWAGNVSDPLAADFLWMYDDGWAGKNTINGDCTSPTAPGCWGHRDVILGPSWKTTGAGFDAQTPDGPSLAELFVG